MKNLKNKNVEARNFSGRKFGFFLVSNKITKARIFKSSWKTGKIIQCVNLDGNPVVLPFCLYKDKKALIKAFSS